MHAILTAKVRVQYIRLIVTFDCMRIAVNTRLLLAGKLEGIGRFTDEILRRLTADHPEVEFFFLFDRPCDAQFIYGPNVTPVVLPPPTRHPLLWYLWFEWILPRWLRKNRIDLFISPDGFGSLRASTPYLPVIHDLNFEHQPENLPTLHRWYYRHFFPKYAAMARRVATVSEYSKLDIAERYGIEQDRIDVVYNAASDGFKPLSPAEKRVQQERWAGGHLYFIYVGALNPRKNIPRMLRAFDLFWEQTNSQMRLLITGDSMYLNGAMKQAFQKLKHRERVVFTGRLSAQALPLAVGGAHALVLVSRFEGFGIPVLEAMKCDVPVIASNSTSLPEVVGDAGLLVDPENEAAIAQAIDVMATDSGVREQCVEAGRRQQERFQWQRSADQLWASIEQCNRERV